MRVLTESGLLPFHMSHEKIIHARRKFIATQAMSTRARAHHFFRENASCSFASSLPGSSHLILTNPHIGSQFSVYSVHFLSEKSRFAFGGIPMPNSSTFIFVSRAVRKCPISCMKTTMVRIVSVRRIQKIIDILFCHLLFYMGEHMEHEIF
jgi:hypothetical protein